MDNMEMPTPKPKTGVIVTAILASAVIFGGLGYYIGSMYKANGTTYSPSPGVRHSPSPSVKQTPSAATEGSKKYENTSGGYSVVHPSNIEPGISINDTTNSVNFSHTTGGQYDAPASIMILSIDVSNSSSTLTQLAQSEKTKSEKEPTRKVIQTDTAIDGVDAIKQTYQTTFGGESSVGSSASYLIARGGKAYIVKIADESDEILSDILKSFVFTK